MRRAWRALPGVLQSEAMEFARQDGVERLFLALVAPLFQLSG